MGGILSYLQDILGGGDSVLVNKKEWGGDSVRGGFCPTLKDLKIMKKFKVTTFISLLHTHRPIYRNV